MRRVVAEAVGEIGDVQAIEPLIARLDDSHESVREDYSHLDGALYRLVISENQFIASIATYLVVLNDLPVCEKNAPLLLLTTGKKKIEFWR